jgi:hypothetical protein
MKRSGLYAAVLAVSILGAVLAFLHQPQQADAKVTETPPPSAAPADVGGVAAMPNATPAAPPEDGFRIGEAGLTPEQRAGREIWFKATAGNDRFHTYGFQQRIGVLIDWFRVLRADQRDQRFHTWGLINDPGCCVPGSPNCPAKSLDETYGFDYCPGDDVLLKYVGREGYRDPGCDFQDAPPDPNDPKGHQTGRESACNLAFGTSTGALGFRKFPNPRFDPVAWKKLNGGTSSWRGYDGALSDDPKRADSQVTRLADGSIEPPFRIGMACGGCHIAFSPVNPPADPEHPGWANIKGLVGNQYTRISELMVSGMPRNSLEWQVFAHSRPGTTDTSAVPTDQVNNAGTINALINTAQRPTFANEDVVRWHKASTCPTGAKESDCWCEPEKPGKCWEKRRDKEAVHHILKGGEDSVGALGAIQRVYFNIGSCSEQCWMNHLTDLRQLDPTARNFGQTPMELGQCRRDCPNFRAIEDRLPDILAFFLSPEGTAADLRVARENRLKQLNPKASYDQDDLTTDLEKQFGKGAVGRGRVVFAANCARCHSSGKPPFDAIDFQALDPKTGLRADWLGNDQATPATEVGTDRCRALHANHVEGHIWSQFASETYKSRPPVPGIPDPNGGGRGYYRNLSLLNLWAHAPFMHNNAVGPELCGWGGERMNPYEFYRPGYVDASQPGLPLLPADKQPACWKYDPSVDGRFKLYVASMRDLLHPAQRIPKATKLDQDIVLDVGPRIWDGKEEKKVIGFTVKVPAGATAGDVGNFQHKALILDLVDLKLHPDVLKKRLTGRVGADNAVKLAAELKTIADTALSDPGRLVDAVAAARRNLPLFWSEYSSCTEAVENAGHPFGEDLPETDKNALIAFLATL